MIHEILEAIADAAGSMIGGGLGARSNTAIIIVLALVVVIIALVAMYVAG